MKETERDPWNQKQRDKVRRGETEDRFKKKRNRLRDKFK